MCPTSLKILVMYSDKSTAVLGAKVSNQLRAKLGREFNIAQTIWNAELLRSSRLREIAALEARESDLVIIATSEGLPLPAEMAQWLKMWDKKPRHSPSAMVALLRNQSAEPAEHPVEESLHRAANRAHMDFFCHSEAADPEELIPVWVGSSN